MKPVSKKFTVLAALALASFTGAIGWWSGQRMSHAVATAPVAGRKVLYWYDPMVQNQQFDKPGKSPFMDMQLVPKFGPAAAADCQASEVMSEAMEGTP